MSDGDGGVPSVGNVAASAAATAAAVVRCHHSAAGDYGRAIMPSAYEFIEETTVALVHRALCCWS